MHDQLLEMEISEERQMGVSMACEVPWVIYGVEEAAALWSR